MIKNKKQWRFILTDELENLINDYKKMYGLHENRETMSHLIENSFKLNPSTLNSINKVCNDFNLSKEKLITPIIENYVEKTLKKQGVVKDKNKNTVKAESELLEVLKIIVEDFKNKPVEERKFISPTFVYKYLMINSDKYRQKNYPVIKRVLDGFSDIDITFIKQYHEENNLSVRSNLKY